jgi:putative ABC transport system permease protein
MKTRDLAELAGRNLREAVLRNSLTTLGIAVGVASLVAMLSLGVGLQELASRRVTRSGLFDTIYVTPRQNFRGFGPMPRKAAAPAAESKPLDEAARQEIQKLPNVLEVYPEIRFATEVRFGEAKRVVTVAGLPPSAKTNDALQDMQGSFFSGPEAAEAILQVDFARALLADASAQPNSLIGKSLVVRYAERRALESSGGWRPSSTGGDPARAPNWGFTVVPRERTLRIVGILQTEPGAGMGGFFRGGVFVPLALAQSLRTVQLSDLRDVMRAAQTVNYLSLTVKVANPSQVAAVEAAIVQKGFSAFSLLDVSRNIRRFFAILDLFLGIFGSLALAVASLGIVNTLVMAILERRREIGILKALGAADGDVRQLFFAEAGAMGLLGGTLGVTLGWVIGRVINFGTNIYLRRQELPPETFWSVPWWLVLGAMTFSILVSLAAGLYPASRAAQLDPVQALRYE